MSNVRTSSCVMFWGEWGNDHLFGLGYFCQLIKLLGHFHKFLYCSLTCHLSNTETPDMRTSSPKLLRQVISPITVVHRFQQLMTQRKQKILNKNNKTAPTNRDPGPRNRNKIKQKHRSIQLIVKSSIFIESNPKRKKIIHRRNTKRKMQGVVLNPTYSRPQQTLDPPSCSRPPSKV